MNEEYKKLITDVLTAHPSPWKQHDGYTDRGGRFHSIVDARFEKIFDGEFGYLSESVFNLLLNFPEAVEILGIKP